LFQKRFCRNEASSSRPLVDDDAGQVVERVVQDQEAGVRRGDVKAWFALQDQPESGFKVGGCKFVQTQEAGVGVMITIFCDFCQFSAKNLAFFSKTNVMIQFLHNLALF
jgi:hypothetical protein